MTKETSIQTICCAFDFSETAELALEQALSLARQHAARLVLAHVVEPVPLGPYPVFTAPHNELGIQSIVRERIEGMVEKLRKEALIVEGRVELGNPGPQLLEMAEDEGADLVVIGTRGLTGFQHLLLGSTAEYVVRRSICPVLAIHPDDKVLDHTAETVIVPTDLSPDATLAVDAFVALFGETQRPRVILAYADRTPPYLEPFRHDTLLRTHQRDVVKEEIEHKMEPVVATLKGAGFEVETAVLDGDPVSVITDLARERKADFVVLSTHGWSAVVNVLLGKTAQRIVQHAPCPVLTVRSRKIPRE